jgi:hypothetical protein
LVFTFSATRNNTLPVLLAHSSDSLRVGSSRRHLHTELLFHT